MDRNDTIQLKNSSKIKFQLIGFSESIQNIAKSADSRKCTWIRKFLCSKIWAIRVDYLHATEAITQLYPIEAWLTDREQETLFAPISSSCKRRLSIQNVQAMIKILRAFVHLECW